MKHMLGIEDLRDRHLARILSLASDRNPPQALAGKGASLLFEKPSARTRSATEMAVVQLGGHPTYIAAAEVGLDKRESVEDVTRTLGCYSSVIGARVSDHETLKRMASVSNVPIINLLSDRAHPTQAIADLLTIKAELQILEGLRLAYIGDANNVARSLVFAASLAGLAVRVASPNGYGLTRNDLRRMRQHGCEPFVTKDPVEAVRGAHVVYTDVWTSMGQESEAEQRRKAFAGFTVNQRLMAQAGRSAIFMHCLPAHRGEEVDEEVIDGPRSRVWQQAANRMHAARGVLLWLMEQADPTDAWEGLGE